jgi:transcriptional regulator with XRE-family HTH domain
MSLSPKHRLFGRNLQKARKMKGLTQEKLAEKCGISVTYLQQLEAGQKNPSISILAVLHKNVSAPWNDLFSGI